MLSEHLSWEKQRYLFYFLKLLQNGGIILLKLNVTY